MKISELIEILDKMKKEYGDLDVVYDDGLEYDVDPHLREETEGIFGKIPRRVCM